MLSLQTNSVGFTRWAFWDVTWDIGLEGVRLPLNESLFVKRELRREESLNVWSPNCRTLVVGKTITS
jgi:hypothetical protein